MWALKFKTKGKYIRNTYRIEREQKLENVNSSYEECLDNLSNSSDYESDNFIYVPKRFDGMGH